MQLLFLGLCATAADSPPTLFKSIRRFTFMHSNDKPPPIYSLVRTTPEGTVFHHPYLKSLEFIIIIKMSRQSGDSMVINSSIALLQERFRQLERAKEMREVKESLRLISESHQVGPTTSYNILPTLFFHSELIIPTSQPLQTCSSFLQHNLQSKQTHLQVTETPRFANLWSTDTVMHRSTNFDDSDVDTSLHL